MLQKSVKINKHIVVFESDDWGSIRIPSKEVLNTLNKKGIVFSAPNSYDIYDSLETNDDLECLMEVLFSVKDKNNNPAKITLDTVVANPDFERIKKNGFNEYIYEPYTETLKKYPQSDRIISLIKEGVENKVFMPQFHGREHLNFQKWMKYLQNGNKDALTGFKYGLFSNYIRDNSKLTHVLAAYDIESSEEKYLIRKSINEGLLLFEDIFGFKSKTMISPCYIWDDYIEEEANLNGIEIMQGSFIQTFSKYENKYGNKFRVRGHYFGEYNKLGQKYLTRNCLFEPTQDKRFNSDFCLSQIDKMFRKGLPAIVSCHRLNFVGELCTNNRDENLKDFSLLLKRIVKKYPDVEFLSSDKLLEYI